MLDKVVAEQAREVGLQVSAESNCHIFDVLRQLIVHSTVSLSILCQILGNILNLATFDGSPQGSGARMRVNELSSQIEVMGQREQDDTSYSRSASSEQQSRVAVLMKCFS